MMLLPLRQGLRAKLRCVLDSHFGPYALRHAQSIGLDASHAAKGVFVRLKMHVDSCSLAA